MKKIEVAPATASQRTTLENLRKYRRDGAGTQATHAIFQRFPGQWEAAVAGRNVDALAFWRKAINGCPRSTHIEEQNVTNTHWNGPVIRFRIHA